VRRKRIVLWLGVAALCALIVGATASAQRSAPVKVALVTDIGGLNDKGFNHLSYVGLQRAEKKLGINGRVFITNSANDRKPNLQSAAQQGYNLVIAVGVLFEFGPLDDVAPAFPKTKFAGVDVDWSGLSSKPTNVRGIQFREQEAGYLVGYIAGLWETRHPAKGKMVVGAVGANKVPAIVRYIAGYRAGVHKANRHIKVQVDYANDPTFADQAKCKETTLNQIGKGSRIEFQVAGACGLGGLSAAKQKHIWGHRRRRRSELPRAAHPDQRSQEGRRLRLRRHQGVQGESVGLQGRVQRELHPEEPRHRVRQAELQALEGRPDVHHQEGRRDREGDHLGEDQAPDLVSSHTVLGGGRRPAP